MRTKIYVLGLACILLISCGKKGGAPTGPADFASYKPNIEYFTANPSTVKLGEKSTLSWEVHDCTSVEIDGGIGSVNPTGSIEVSPLETTNYTLTATNTGYEQTSQIWEIVMKATSTKVCTITVEK